MYKMFYIYKITNTLNGKHYFGQTNNPTQRWSQYRSAAKHNPNSQVITRAIAKYGVEAFTFEAIVGYKTQEDVNVAEEEFIQLNDARNPLKGYNVDRGGGVGPRPSGIGEKIAASLKKYYENNESKLKGISLSEEVKAKISEGSMGKPGTNLGKTFDDEWRIKISKSRAGTERVESRRFSEDIEKEICRLYVEEEKSAYSLGKKFNCYGTVIIDILNRNKIEIRKSNYNKYSNCLNIFTKEQELEMCQAYETGKVSRAELATRYNCGKTTVRNILLRNKVKI